ncbi:helix-turn-helix domain-containing protein [Rhodovulum adriaticum]|uniref:Excisionase family DNA binding protein n=1 Tax=Rhodovulum adriaticum TaxID=35804 RepID=A0A4R2NDZ6_RHOAD|nr:helix-turn-helix domain-containing protein [Rhodovulum adriaticum]MBK1637319.1 hypothetical protein [Rhodovulum adriaticum]TCP19302.1 excisionase family DNA binding protein [Rhodovulum adriaticum]
MLTTPPDETYTTPEAANQLEVSDRQVRRYLSSGRLKGTRVRGHWTTTALDIWRFKGIADEMLESWRRYCIEYQERQAAKKES